MADIDLTFGQQIPAGTIFKYRDMGDGTHAEVVAADVVGTAGLTDTELRATAVPVSGPVTDAELRATAVPVSGTVTASGPLTDTQLRAVAVPISGTVSVTNAGGYSAALTITRPANQTPYTAGDVVGGALEFPLMGPDAGRVLLNSTQLELDIAALPSGMSSFDLCLYSVTPPSALADNAPFDLEAGDRASWLGRISLGTPVDRITTCYVEVNAILKQLKLAGTSLFGYLVTVGAYTPAANSEVYVVTLHSVAL